MEIMKLALVFLFVAFLVPIAVQAGRATFGESRSNPLFVEVVGGRIECR